MQLVLPAGVPLLHPETQVFEGMIQGWRNQMLARNLAESTIVAAVRVVRAFKAHHDVWPWLWTPAMSDEWFADLRSVHHIATSTVRSYQVALRGFCRYVTDPAYGWAEDCERRFGTHPIQLINEVNAALRGWTYYFRHALAGRRFSFLRYFTWRRFVAWQREQHRWGWKGVKRWLRRPNGSWNTITTPAAVLFDPTKVRIERYRYRGNRIPNPYDLTITA